MSVKEVMAVKQVNDVACLAEGGLVAITIDLLLYRLVQTTCLEANQQSNCLFQEKLVMCNSMLAVNLLSNCRRLLIAR